MVRDNPRYAFSCSAFSPHTFLIIETHDVYSEHPYIYAIIRPETNTILLIDTGCGGVSSRPDVEVKVLRDFLETVDIPSNNDRPLNDGGRFGYIVALSHCHYDHILGIEPFCVGSNGAARIVASSYDPHFLSPTHLPEHSLCNFVHIRLPRYTPVLVPHFHRIAAPSTSDGLQDLGFTVLHTPGHTPDSLAIWDEKESVIYIGDTLYEEEPIIFPNEGSIRDWLDSVDFLILFIKDRQVGQPRGTVIRVSCGHATAFNEALPVLQGAKAFIEAVVSGREQARTRRFKRGEVNAEYGQVGDRFRLICPERLVKEASGALR